MSYYDVAAMARDEHLRDRIAACVALEGPAGEHPVQWATQHQWALSASPGWGTAYAYAAGAGVQNPGKDEGVITDQMILSAVQALLKGA